MKVNDRIMVEENNLNKYEAGGYLTGNSGDNNNYDDGLEFREAIKDKLRKDWDIIIRDNEDKNKTNHAPCGAPARHSHP